MRLAEMEIIPGEEKQRILENFNDIQTEYPAGKTIHELFARQAAVTPDGAALVGAGLRALPDRVMQHLTYKELNRKSDQVAQALKEKGVLADDIVAIMVKRSVEMIIGILGILKAGGAYLPIDPGYPQERIDYMVKDSGARVLVSELSEVSKVSEENPTHPTHLTHPTQLCYIIYTSGTTGKPKGVMIEHRNVLNLIVGARHLFDFNGDDTWTVFHSFCFDFSVWEMYGAVLYGGKLIIVPRMTARDPVRFLKVLKNHGVTILNQTPLSFYHLAGEELKHKEKQLKLRYIIFAGDALEPARLKQWREKYPGTRLINMFGITEATVHSTFKEIGDSEIDCNTSNIGKPVVSVSAYVLDENRNLCPWGVPGELYIGGRGVGRGYINRPGLTAERFVSFSYRSYGSHRSYRSIKIYKTGDLVRLRDNGEMEYLGRIDRQVQLRGYRVELGEIEKRLLKHEEITGAAVLAAEGEGSGKYLCAYVVCGREIRVRDLRAYLAKGLPDYMVPSYFIRVERIPLTSNGKLDRKALPEPDGSRLQAGAAYLAPQTGLEQEITDHWLKVLDVDRVGIHDNFFELGGNSLNIMQLNARLKEALARDIPVVSMYKHITVSSFAGYLMEQENRLIHTGKGNRQNRLEETFLQSKKIYTRTLKRTAARKNEREN
jgi:amino acid adenylation domain-containing protein